jgi:thiol-disulfide isomerase/thioredoxin
MTHSLTAVTLIAFASYYASDSAPTAADIALEVAKLDKARKGREEKMYVEYARRLDAAKTDADQDSAERWAEGVLVENRKTDREAIANLMPLLRQFAADKEVFNGLLHSAKYGDDAIRAEAGDLIRRHHLRRPEVLAIAERPWGITDEWVEAIIRDLLKDDATPAARLPRLRFALARHLKSMAELPARIAGDLEGMAVKYGPDRLAKLRKSDVPNLESEALALFDALVKEGQKAELSRGLTLAEAARSDAYEIRHLSVGKKAPEIVGEDLDGAKLRLSDFKGKVVVLSFWGTKCSACMRLVPHEKEIAELYKGRPFALVGVCSDEDRQKVKPVLGEKKITWRSFWCGPKGYYGELPQAWNVTRWPTIYVIDHTGVIRSKTARGGVLDRLLTDLINEAEKEVQK